LGRVLTKGGSNGGRGQRAAIVAQRQRPDALSGPGGGHPLHASFEIPYFYDFTFVSKRRGEAPYRAVTSGSAQRPRDGCAKGKVEVAKPLTVFCIPFSNSVGRTGHAQGQ